MEIKNGNVIKRKFGPEILQASRSDSEYSGSIVQNAMAMFRAELNPEKEETKTQEGRDEL